MSKLLRKNSRNVSAATLIAGAIILLMFVFVDRSRSANPTNGLSIQPVQRHLGRTAFGGSRRGRRHVRGRRNCDTFLLTCRARQPTGGQEGKVVIAGRGLGMITTVYIHKGTPTRPIVAHPRSGSGPETIEFIQMSPASHRSVFRARDLLVGATAGSVWGEASVVRALCRLPPSPGASPTPTAPPLAAPGTPRFHHITARRRGDDAGERLSDQLEIRTVLHHNNIVTGAANLRSQWRTANYYGGSCPSCSG